MVALEKEIAIPKACTINSSINTNVNVYYKEKL